MTRIAVVSLQGVDFTTAQRSCERCQPKCYLCHLPMDEETFRAAIAGQFGCIIYEESRKITKRNCPWCGEKFSREHLLSHVESFPWENIENWVMWLGKLQPEIGREVLHLKRKTGEWRIWGFSNWRCVLCSGVDGEKCALEHSPLMRVRCIRSIGITPEMLGVSNKPNIGYIVAPNDVCFS